MSFLNMVYLTVAIAFILSLVFPERGLFDVLSVGFEDSRLFSLDVGAVFRFQREEGVVVENNEEVDGDGARRRDRLVLFDRPVLSVATYEIKNYRG
jgi:hypothetical protein